MSTGTKTSSRSLALLAAVALVAAGLGWLALRTAPAPVVVGDLTTVAVPDTAAPKAPAADLAAPGSTATESADEDERTAAEVGVLGADNEAFTGALWVEGLVRYPPDTPRGERAFVHARGRKLGQAQEHRFEIDANGRFRAAFAPNTRKGWLRVEGRFLYTPTSLQLDPSAPPASIMLEPQVGGCLRVTLVPSRLALPRASELSGARGTAWGNDSGGGTNPQRQARAAEGAIEFWALVPDIEWYGNLNLAGFEIASLESVRVKAAQVLEIDVAVTLAARLSGIVRDSAGAPVDGAAIVIEVRQGTSSTSHTPGMTTKDGGKFSVQSTIGTATLTARKNGFLEAQSEPFELSEGSERSDIVIVLDSGLAVAGVVRWPDGKPAANATVEAIWAEHEPVFMFGGLAPSSTRAGPDGAFRLTGLDSGPLTIRARAKPESGKGPKAGRPEWTARADEVQAGTTGLVLVLEPGSSIRGRVVDDLGAAVSSARVRTEPVEGIASRRSASANVDDEGRFELIGVTDGPWEVLASSKTRESGRVSVVMPADAARELTLVLPRAGKISGRVLGVDGKPRAGAMVEAAPRSDRHMYTGPDRPSRSDSEGRFTFEVAAGPLAIHASAPDTVPSASIERDIAPGQTVEGLELVLRRGGTIEGTVRDAQDRPRAGVTVHASTMNAPGDSDPAKTAADGSFRIERVTPGKVYVYAMQIDDEGDDANVEIELADGGVAHVQLGGRAQGSLVVTGTVRGKVPLAGVRVSFFGPSSGPEGEDRNRMTKTDANGRYETVLTAPGTYWAGVDPEGNAGVYRSVEITDAPSQVVDFVVPSGRIAGRVVGPNGKPLGDVGINLGPDGPHTETVSISQGWVSTSADGTFEFEGVQAGTYQLTTYVSPIWGRSRSHKTLANVTLHGIELKPDGVREDIEIRLTEGATILARVLTPDGRPATGAVVTWKNAQTGDSAPTDAGGIARLEGLGPGETTLFAGASQATLARPVVVVVRAGETTETTLYLVPATPLVVRVFDKAGVNISDSTELGVWVTDARGQTWDQEWSDSPASGARRFGPLPDGDYEVRVRFGSNDVRNTVHVSGGTEREFVVREPD